MPTLIVGSLSALIPVFHWLLISEVGRHEQGWRMMLILGFSISAQQVFSRMAPECFYPGRFDLLGHSHQIWHVLIFLGMAQYSEIMIEVFALTGSEDFCR
eukprot:TRINITY_DN84145_c0_g1_i1.p1 TRINITY_DN84145_c0_g1~~TRINITY_DN84145_c0_g1_i1.p1  ORF type:complete len:100 (-),score=11.98 TRINITY_DN84145_c0_g1_i1:89-388(-)